MKRAVVITCVLATIGCSKGPVWEALPLGTVADFRSIWFTDANHGWIGGGSHEISGGLVGRTEDGGKTWRFTSGLTARDRMSVRALHFFDNDRGLAATDNGRILSTPDGGESWTPVERRGRVNSISSLSFLDARRGWAVGHGDVVRTDDAGETWDPVTAESGDRSYESPVRAMQFHDERHGWVAGMHASLLRTRDGGATWEPVATPFASGDRPHFWDLCFVDRNTGWVVGEEGTILATTDGGTWVPQSTGLKDARSAPKLERIPRAGGVDVIDAGDRTPGFTIAAVRFVDRRNGWIAGFYAGLGRSLVLRTADAGATWVVEADINGEELRTLFVQGRERLWAIGARVRRGPQAIYRRAVVTK